MVEADDLLAPLFGGTVSHEHRANVTAWWCEVMGGSPDYSDKHGGYAHMLRQHLDRALQRVGGVDPVVLDADQVREAVTLADPGPLVDPAGRRGDHERRVHRVALVDRPDQRGLRV